MPELTITSAEIAIRVLRVDKKQMTQAVFKQLPERPVYSSEADTPAITRHGDIWGWVNHHAGCNLPLDSHLHLIWSDYSSLFTDTIFKPWDSLRLYDAKAAYGYDRKNPATETFQKAFRKKLLAAYERLVISASLHGYWFGCIAAAEWMDRATYLPVQIDELPEISVNCPPEAWLLQRRAALKAGKVKMSSSETYRAHSSRQ